MPEPLSANPQDMIKDGGAFTLIGTTCNDIVTSARASLPGGNYWGDHKQDPVALTYGGNLLPNREGLFDTVGGTGTTFFQTGDQVTGDGVTFHNSDLTNAESVPGLHVE
jgi:hypothetical protein